MSSCGPGRTSPYSKDFQWRMVWQKEVMGLKLKNVATNLSVDISTVWKVIKLFENTGSVVKRPYPKGRRTKKLTDVIKLLNVLILPYFPA